MAFQKGTQIRPELNRMDFSGIERGGQALGAGIGSMLNKFATSIKEKKQKELMKEKEQAALGLFKNIFNGALTEEEIKDGIKGLGVDDTLRLGQQLTQQKQLQKIQMLKAQEEARENKISEAINRMALGENVDLSGLSSEEQAKVKVNAKKLQKDISTGKGAIMSVDELNKRYPLDRYSVSFVELPGNKVQVTQATRGRAKEEESDNQLVVTLEEYEQLKQRFPSEDGYKIPITPLSNGKFKVGRITQGTQGLIDLGGFWDTEPSQDTKTGKVAPPSLFDK